MTIRFLLAYILFSIFTNTILAQDIDFLLTRKYADNSFRDGDYAYALENYLVLFEDDKKNIDLNFKVGICYTETNIDKGKAIPLLEYVVSHNNKPVRSYYYLGRAYMYSYRFIEAVEAFYEYKMDGISQELLSESDRLIEMCYYALELINQPVNVTFEKINASVNTKFDEFYPFISADGLNMFFTSNRTYVDEFEDYIANVFYSVNKKGIWESGLELPDVTTYDNEQVVGVTPLADKIMIYANGDYSTHDIKVILKKGSKFTNISSETLPNDINTEDVEMGACLSADGNTLYFASDRRGGRGGLDIYVAKKNAGGLWGQPESLGTTINTEYDDNFPTLSADGKYLYFASKGHSGVGGYDIFQSFFNEETGSWTPPLNLGFPINTPVDNTTISFTQDGKTAYMSANRKEGFGKLDVYKLTFGEDAQQPAIYMGNVMVGTEANSVPYSEDFLKAYATFYDEYDNIIAQLPVLSDGGQFFASLYPGNYKLEVKFSGAKSGYSEQVSLTEADVNEPKFQMIYLKPIE